MPTGKNYMAFLWVNFGFCLYIASIFYSNQVSNIKKNWPLYRCNPIYMPLANDIEENFSYCIQNMQTSLFGYLLEPLTFITSSLSTILGSFGTEINSIRAMINNIRSSFSTIFDSIFGVFLNMIIEFQKITISIKDLVGKTIGILVTFLYTMNGSYLTMQSTWKGPTGQIVQTLGKCFHPKTRVLLKNGTKKYMKNLHLGDILEDGSIVEALLKINNPHKKIPFYIIKNQGIDGDNIYVTGSHFIYDLSLNRFIKVENADFSLSHKSKSTKWFSCLITNTHKIKIGEKIFWDWEDYILK
jgi:hypothetical protein